MDPGKEAPKLSPMCGFTLISGQGASSRTHFTKGRSHQRIEIVRQIGHIMILCAVWLPYSFPRGRLYVRLRKDTDKQMCDIPRSTSPYCCFRTLNCQLHLPHMFLAQGSQRNTTCPLCLARIGWYVLLLQI